MYERMNTFPILGEGNERGFTGGRGRGEGLRPDSSSSAMTGHFEYAQRYLLLVAVISPRAHHQGLNRQLYDRACYARSDATRC